MKKLIGASIILILSVMTFVATRPNARDVAISYPVKIFLHFQGYSTYERAIEVTDPEILQLSNVMAWLFDSVDTASGDFDFQNYPYWHLYKVAMGKRNRFLCGGISDAYAFSVNQLGFHTRILQLVGPSYVSGLDRFDTHVAVEVKLTNPERWVLADPTFDAFWGCDGKNFVSYREVHECLQSGKKISPIHVRRDTAGRLKLAGYKTPPEMVFFAGRGTERFKVYGAIDYIKQKLTGARIEPYGEIYELPTEGLIKRSAEKYRVK